MLNGKLITIMLYLMEIIIHQVLLLLLLVHTMKIVHYQAMDLVELVILSKDGQLLKVEALNMKIMDT